MAQFEPAFEQMMQDEGGYVLHEVPGDTGGMTYAGIARNKNPQWPGWAGWRAVVAGRLPQVGPVSHAPGLWLATAYGSRGLTWAALAGEMIAGSLDGEPDILDTDLARQIAPR